MVHKKVARRLRIRHSIRKKISGTDVCPRLSVYKSNRGLYVQLVDDVKGCTLAWASSVAVGMKGKLNLAVAEKVGEMMGKKAKEQGLKEIVFDRSGYIYHGRLRAMAERMRKEGVKF